MNWLGRIIQKEILEDDIVLDLGCGIMQATTDILNQTKFASTRYLLDMINYKMENSMKGNLKCRSILGCDIWDKYLQSTSMRYPTVKLSMDELGKFVDGSYDIVICLDVLEHLELDTSIRAIEEMKRITRKKVIIYTPSKYIDNNEHVKDSWHMGSNQYQAHRCFVNPHLLQDMGFKTSFPKPDYNTLGVYIK